MMDEFEVIYHRQVEGLSIFFNTVDYRTLHIHPEWELIWVLDGGLAVTSSAERYLVRPGDLILFNPNEPHELHKAGESCTFLCLQISPNILPELLPVHVDEKLPHRCMQEAEVERLRESLKQIMKAYLAKEDHYSLFCIGKSFELLYFLLKSLPTHLRTKEETEIISKRNARIKRLIQYVDENYMHKIRLADFAEREGCSLSYLSRFIKCTMNQSFQEYVTSVRFHCACKLIVSGEKKMLDVCMESGFSDYRYFSREFQRQYGMTPEAYRHYLDRNDLTSATVRHSLHSKERFYSPQESRMLAEKYLK